MSKKENLYSKRVCLYAMLISVFFLPSTTSAAFLKDLALGSSGEDVIELQKILNLDSRTRVSSIGPGSLGQETAYFGPLTHSAVIRFQELYAPEVLYPLALFRGTGYVGRLTRQKLNTLGTSFSTTEVAQPETVTTALSPKIFSVSPSKGSDGTRVTIYGEGFLSTGNKVYVSFDELENASSVDGKQISFTIRDPFPDDLKFPPSYIGHIPDLTYGFVVENKNGRSNVVEFTLINSKVNNQ